MIIVTCGIWLAVLLLIDFGIDRIHSSVLGGRLYRFFMFPGAIVHHVIQAVTCVLTGAPVKRVKFFDNRESVVIHSEPKLPGAGPILIALVPIVACGAMLVVLPMMFFQPLQIGCGLPSLTDFSLDSISTWAKSFIDTFTDNIRYFGSASYTVSLIAMLYLGLVLSVAAGMDMRGLRFSLTGITLLTGGADLAAGMFKGEITSFTQAAVWPLLSFAVPIALIFLLLSAFLACFATMFRKRSKQKQSSQEIRDRLTKLAET